MKRFNILTKANWRDWFAANHLTVTVNGSESLTLELFDEVIAEIEFPELITYFEFEYADLFHMYSFIDEDGERNMDQRHFEQFDYTREGNMHIIVGLYLQHQNELETC